MAENENAVVHYALCDLAACWEDMSGHMRHTTRKKSVTCGECKKVLKSKKRLKGYMAEVEADSED